MVNREYNPDVLNCIANLSNDEVFTPPVLANQVLDMLPQELFQSPETTFLDPFSKSGVFLREIVKRLDRGLVSKIPNRQKRIDHIMHHQVYGIALTELTSLLSRRTLYCSKRANSDHSVSYFENEEGHIQYRALRHTWVNGKCRYCGSSKDVYDRSSESEQYAYQFIHTDHPETIFNNMKFDVIIGNPPYQLDTGGDGTTQAKPIYQLFVNQARRLNPRYLCMITPSRWFAGGMGMEEFRSQMMNNDSVKIIVDYTNAKDCFPGVDISGGVSYFLVDTHYHGPCIFVSNNKGKISESKRYLNEFPVLVRYNEAISIIHKIGNIANNSLSMIATSLSPFGLGSSERGKEKGGELTLYHSKGLSTIDRVSIGIGKELIDKYKVMLSKTTAEHAGEADANGMYKVLSTLKRINPKEVCTFSYFIMGPFETSQEADNLIAYLKTKFARFLLLQAVSSINLSKDKFQFVPLQDFSHPWTDEMLYEKYHLDEKEIAFIESMIRPME